MALRGPTDCTHPRALQWLTSGVEGRLSGVCVAICAEHAKGLQRELSEKTADWGNERQQLQGEVGRLGQRAVQADTLQTQVHRQAEDLKEIRVRGISSEQTRILVAHTHTYQCKPEWPDST